MRERLQAYADRGVFRGFAEQPARGGRRRFTFLWLAPSPFTLTYDPATGALAFRDLLPNVPARSPLAGALRRFIRGRASAERCRSTGASIPAPRRGRLRHPPRRRCRSRSWRGPGTTATA